MSAVRMFAVLCAVALGAVAVSRPSATGAMDFWQQNWQRPGGPQWGFGQPQWGGSPWGGQGFTPWGAPPQAPAITITPRRERAREPDRRAAERGREHGGDRNLCVRTCDGFYFPLPDDIDAKDSRRACNALCPGTETAVFRADGDDIESATDPDGKRYSALANAFAYRTELKPACACAAQARRGLAALRHDDTLARGDVVVTETGVQVFTGRGNPPYDAGDFTPYRQARGLSRKDRSWLAEIDRPYASSPQRLAEQEAERSGRRSRGKILAREVEDDSAAAQDDSKPHRARRGAAVR